MEGKRSGAGRDARLWPSRDGPDGARRATLAQSLHSHWANSSGVNVASATYDQLNLPCIAAAEQIARRVLMTERAVRKNPKNP
eukprot:2692546-Amphidinium_carterae.1